MNEKAIYNQINELLDATDYPMHIGSVGDIEDFLLDDDNRRFGAYAVIGRLYDDLVGVPEKDRYSEVAMEEEEEQYEESLYDGMPEDSAGFDESTR